MSDIKINSNLQLYQWQSDVINMLKSHWKGYTHVIKSKRQCGKSILMQSILVSTAINNPRTVSIYLAPTLEQARKIFDSIKSVILPTKIYKKHNDVRMFIKLTNAAEIQFKSAEQREALRGYTVTGIMCVDEAAYINDSIFFDCLAWVNVSNAPVLICSTPRHKTGFFYNLYTQGSGEVIDKVISYNWSSYDTSALLSNEKLEQYRRDVPQTQFKTEFLGEFLENEGGVFGDYDDIVSNDFTPNLNLYMGIDWGTGTGQDETAICIFNSNKEMVDLVHFADKDETSTIEYIISLLKKYHPLKVQVETNSIGQVFYGLLDKAIKANKINTMLLRFTTTNESKERIINNFQVAIQRKEVTILDDVTLKIQMDMYEMKLNNNGKHIYNAPTGYHDDCIIAMLLAFNCITTGYYAIR